MYKSSLFINQKTLGKLIIYFFILLCFFDLIYPNKGENVNRIVPVIGRSLFLFVSILYVFNTVLFREIRIKKTLTGGSFVLLGFLFLVVSILINLTSFVININIFVKILYWIFGFFFFHYALSKGTINEKQLKIFVSIAVLIYFSVIIRDFNNVDLFRGSKNYFVSNNSYILLKLTPLVFLINHRIKKVLLILISIGIIMSFKRGAILAIFFILMMFVFSEMKKSKLFIGIFTLIVISGLISFVLSLNLDVLYSRLTDFEDIDSFGSGRGKMFGLIINDMLIEDFNLINFIFGNGFLSTKDFFGSKIGYRILAHSDFFEFFYDYGVLGLIIYLNCIKKLFLLNTFYKKTEYSLVIKSTLIIIVLSAFYSINFFTPEMIYLMLPIAFLEFKRIQILSTNSL